jgi:uncharacterized YigZ family protein
MSIPNIDQYHTIDQVYTGEYKSKGSKFICYLMPTDSIDTFQGHLTQVKRDHLKSRHYCYAYRIGYQGEVYRINDDGEPSGTAGKPIYGQLIKHELTNVCGIVIRYFGGTKLGTSGLIAAYKSSTEEAINQANILTKTRMGQVKIAFDYSLMGKVMQVIKNAKLDIDTTDFGVSPSLILTCPYSITEATVVKFKATYLDRVIADIKDTDVLEGIQIDILDTP